MNKIKSEIKLKSCPFCGKKVNSVKGYGGIQFFECTNKHCGAMVSFRKYTEGKSEMEKWNRRADNESRTDKERNET